jgi:hypothetical protein
LYLADRELSLKFKFLIDGSSTVFQDKADFIESLKLRVDADNLWMTNCHQLLQVGMNKLNGHWMLQTLLEDFFKTVDQVGLGLLAEIGMCPFPHS